MRHAWLARAVLAAAVSVPVAALTGSAHAATSGQQKTVILTSVTRSLVHQVAAKTVPAKTMAKTVPAKPATALTYNEVAASLAMTLVGDPYAYGGTSPAGFDCSGLTQWVYQHSGDGKLIPRMAEDQFAYFRPVSQAAAVPGDLVFFHDTSDLGSYVYHVGIYEGGDMMVAATVPGEGVQYQSFTWAGDTLSFGTISH